MDARNGNKDNFQPRPESPIIQSRGRPMTQTANMGVAVPSFSIPDVTDLLKTLLEVQQCTSQLLQTLVVGPLLPSAIRLPPTVCNDRRRPCSCCRYPGRSTIDDIGESATSGEPSPSALGTPTQHKLQMTLTLGGKWHSLWRTVKCTLTLYHRKDRCLTRYAF